MSSESLFQNMLRNNTALANSLKGLHLLDAPNGTLSVPTVSLATKSIASEVGQSILSNQRNFM